VSVGGWVLSLPHPHPPFISDNNHCVTKWRKDVTEEIVVAGGNGQGNSLNQLFGPEGVIVDHLDQIYVTDTDNHRVIRR